MEKEFQISEYIGTAICDKEEQSGSGDVDHQMEQFKKVCIKVREGLDRMQTEASRVDDALALQRQAILGNSNAVKFYQLEILKILREETLESKWFPAWYENLAEAVFQELYGMAGLTEWIEGRRPELKESSSAKVIGERIYFLIKGKMVLQEQTLPEETLERIRTALLMTDAKARRSDAYHEVYLINGTRVTLFGDGIAKKGQDCYIFRKFLVPEYTFEEQAGRHTIPRESIPLFTAMIKTGFNVAFVGAVRTAKTTFLTTWQSYENPALEGVLIETDPEIPLHYIMPDAPVVQLVPDDQAYNNVIRNVMRSDADYIIIAEARDGKALNLAIRAANKGTRRVKMTYHTTDVVDICYDIADEITKIYGGNIGSTIIKVAKSFNYVFQFVQLPDKSKKRLKAIWEIRYDPTERQVTMHQICKYRYRTDDWVWAFDEGADKAVIGEEEDPAAYQEFLKVLHDLAEKYPMQGDHVYYPPYNQFFK